MSSARRIEEFTTTFRVKVTDQQGQEGTFSVYSPCLEIAILMAYNLKQLPLPENWREMYGVTVTSAGLKRLRVPEPEGYTVLESSADGGDGGGCIGEMQKSIVVLKDINAKTLQMIEDLAKDIGTIREHAGKSLPKPKTNGKKQGRPVGHIPSNKGSKMPKVTNEQPNTKE